MGVMETVIGSFEEKNLREKGDLKQVTLYMRGRCLVGVGEQSGEVDVQ